VGHRSEGDIVGVMAILTGEPRGAHVEAETAMELWCLDKHRFDNLSREDPELLRFLTELVADRFDSKRPMADRLIGKYLATELIGRGGYSLVYRGQHTGLNRPVVIKMLKHHLALESDFLTAFRNEASIIARLNHENIVRVYDIEERFRTIFIVMEYVEGRRLSEVLEKDGPLTADRALPILIQLCRGLGYAHQMGIVHQDITPDNIFVLPHGKVKILDFGLACFAGAENYLAGTPYYMAPEQVECLPVDSRTDIYSLGITAYKMLTGALPFPEEAGWKVMERHVNEDIPDPIASAPHLSEGLRAFIIRACQRDSGRHYASANDALAALLPLAEAAKTGASEPDFDSSAEAPHYILRHRGKHLAALNRLVAAFNRMAAQYGAALEPSPRFDLSEAPGDSRDSEENR
jgi:serine/threonine protein kinase